MTDKLLISAVLKVWNVQHPYNSGVVWSDADLANGSVTGPGTRTLLFTGENLVTDVGLQLAATLIGGGVNTPPSVKNTSGTLVTPGFAQSCVSAMWLSATATAPANNLYMIAGTIIHPDFSVQYPGTNTVRYCGVIDGTANDGTTFQTEALVTAIPSLFAVRSTGSILKVVGTPLLFSHTISFQRG